MLPESAGQFVVDLDVSAFKAGPWWRWIDDSPGLFLEIYGFDKPEHNGTFRVVSVDSDSITITPVKREDAVANTFASVSRKLIGCAPIQLKKARGNSCEELRLFLDATAPSLPEMGRRRDRLHAAQSAPRPNNTSARFHRRMLERQKSWRVR